MKSWFALAPLVAAGLLAAAVPAAAQQMYKWTDASGKVHYSDKPPQEEAKNVQQKKVGGNYIETAALPYATQIAQQRNPVTLYGGDCGDACDRARALLNRRGIPHTELNAASNQTDQEKLKKLIGDIKIPVLTVGTEILKGYEEGRWQATLDQAGYPKTPPAKAIQAALDDKKKREQEAARAAAIKAAQEKVTAREVANEILTKPAETKSAEAKPAEAQR